MDETGFYCLVNFKGKFIFVCTYGMPSQRYSITENRWEELPEVTSACSLSENVYYLLNQNEPAHAINILHNASASVASQ